MTQPIISPNETKVTFETPETMWIELPRHCVYTGVRRRWSLQCVSHAPGERSIYESEASTLRERISVVWEAATGYVMRIDVPGPIRDTVVMVAHPNGFHASQSPYARTTPLRFTLHPEQLRRVRPIHRWPAITADCLGESANA